ncbi:MAG: DUF4838 domain-containing protein [Bacteroidales bacterium]|nr:DUF4838 domain-containing protein [Bacteroidales bacterium]
MKRFLYPTVLTFLAVVTCILTSCKDETEEFLIPYSPVNMPSADLLSSTVWDAVTPSEGFHAPWDGLEDSTVFRCFTTDSLFFFRFDVKEISLSLKDGYSNEMDVEPEDRVEVFFAPAGKLGTYVGAEIDPMGRVLDYQCTYYRKFDYSWNFRTLVCSQEIRESGYSVAGSVTKKELVEQGVDIDSGFLMGVFRADFRPDGSVNWYSMKKTEDRKPDFHQPSVFFKARTDRESLFDIRGAILVVHDLETVDWPRIAKDNGINTIGTHMKPGEVIAFMQSDKGKAFYEECRELGIHVEHQLHAMAELLPRELFEEDPSMFRMDDDGNRVADFNFCPHSEKAMDIVAAKVKEFAAALPSTNHRYYFWLDDNSSVCQCPECAGYSASDQALMIENRMIKAIREVDPQAMLAHLAYETTMEPPVKVKPEDGIFLEFAPIERQWDRPLSDRDAPGRRGLMSHERVLELLEANIKVFPAETAVALEYWLDVSLASGWKKPAVELPWNPEVFVSDLATYSGYGIRNITSFAVYMDSTYFRSFPDQSCLGEYGSISAVYR